MKKTALIALALAAAFYAHAGFKTLSKLEDKVNENSSRIDRIECQLASTNPADCQ